MRLEQCGLIGERQQRSARINHVKHILLLLKIKFLLNLMEAETINSVQLDFLKRHLAIVRSSVKHTG